MIYRALHTTKEARRERQPHVFHNGCVMTWDGRLDNREDLRLELGDRLQAESAEPTDVLLAATAYQAWGCDAFGRLVGDWAAAVWDQEAQCLLLARDFAGARPLYYAVEADSVVWCSDLLLLADLTGRRQDLSEEFFATYLTHQPLFPNALPFKGVRAVPPAHYLRVDASGIRETQFWQFPAGNMIRYADERDYETHLRLLFREAVKCRLRTESRVAAHLSGGLDSSSTVCMAANLVASGQVETAGIEPVSCVSANSDTDESSFIAIVERHCGLRSHRILCEEHPWCSELQPGLWMPTPSFRVNAAISKAAHDTGARVLLTGIWGDLVMMNVRSDIGALSEALRSLAIRHFLKESAAWANAAQVPLISVVRDAIIPLLPGAMQNAWWRNASTRAMKRRSLNYVADYSLSEAFAGKWCSVPAGKPMLAPASSIPSKRVFLQQFRHLLSLPDRHAHFQYPVESTCALGDRRLIEFVLAIPNAQLCSPGEPRRLMRRAFRGIAPAAILSRQSKGAPAAEIMRQLRPVVDALQIGTSNQEFQLARRGYLDQERFVRRLQDARAGIEPFELQFAKLICAELWLRKEAGVASSTERADSVAAVKVAP